MSVFRGSITEYPGVIVDHFIPFNCERGRAFFLSHCHKDHMTGLGSPALLSALHRRSAKLFCSEVTRLLLLSDPEFTKLAPFLQSLPMEEPISMTLEAYSDCQVLNFTVTLLPAGHCPGSAMFFLQGSNGNVLYTGDFRLTLEETRHLHPLHCGGRVLDVATLYLDTTFCTPVATEIPSREVSRDHILKLIESFRYMPKGNCQRMLWLSQSPRNVVHLQCGMFGYEHIFMGIAKKFNTKIHIAAWKLNAYKGIPAVAECLTTNGNSTRIHACNFRKGARRQPSLPCGSCLQGSQPFEMLSIKPSTLWFLSTSKTLTEPYVFIPACNKYRVIHSMHASYSEICNFVSYLKPKRVVPCVVPLGDSSLSDVNLRLKDLLPTTGMYVREACSGLVSMEREDRLSLQPLRSWSRRKPRKRGLAERDQVSTNSSESDSDWSSGESSTDTIDEFPSSEEQPQHGTVKMFSGAHQPPPSGLGLPSMLMHTHRAPPVSTVASSPSPPSTETSDGAATVGSLQQTPLDLSIDSNPASAPQQTDTTPSPNLIQNYVISERTKEFKDVKEQCPKQSAKEWQYSRNVLEPEISSVPERESTTDVSPNGEWHLSLDESPETRSAYLCSTPHSKRCKLDSPAKECDNKTARKLFHNYKHLPAAAATQESPNGADTPQARQFLSSEYMDQPPVQDQVVEYIDLTQDSDEGTVQQNPPTTRSPIDSQDHQIEYHKSSSRNSVYSTETLSSNLDHQNPTHQEASSNKTVSVPSLVAAPHKVQEAEPEVIILSDSQTSTSTVADPPSQQSFGNTSCDHDLNDDTGTPVLVCHRVPPPGPASPLCLPPTPGREGVESILKRKSIAFS